MSDVDDVLARAAQWQDLLQARDVEGVGEFMHEDYALVLVDPSEVEVPLDEWLQMLPDYVQHSYEIHHQVARVAGDTAAVMTLATQHATVEGGDRSGRFTVTDVWLRDPAGQWRVWRRHSSPPATAGAMPRG